MDKREYFLYNKTLESVQAKNLCLASKARTVLSVWASMPGVKEIKLALPVWRIWDVYPGSRILIFIHPGSRISDPGSKNSNKRER